MEAAMSSKQCVLEARRSLSTALFLVAQASRNVREMLRCTWVSVGDDAPEEKALYVEQEAVLEKFSKAMAAMSNGGGYFTDKRLNALIPEWEERRAALDQEFMDQQIKELHGKLDPSGIRERRSLALKKQEETSRLSESEDQHGGEK